MIDDSGFRFRHRRARVRPRAGPFPGGAARRRPRAEVLARLRSAPRRLHQGRHRLLRQRRAAGRLREDGRRDRRRRRRPGQPDEFLSKTQVGALPGPDHGPGDEPGPGGRAAGVRALSGRRRARVSRADRRSSARSKRVRRPSRRGLAVGDTILRADDRPCRPGKTCRPTSPGRREREVTLLVERSRAVEDVQVVPTARQVDSKSATSACSR